jgi:hypothetical protein
MQQGVPSRAGRHDRKAFLTPQHYGKLVQGRGNSLETRFLLLSFLWFNRWCA